MWLATEHGFFSIVQKPPGQFHVRARRGKDLENLLNLAGIQAEILYTPDGDYASRIVVGQPKVDAIMAALAQSIEYPNFKDRIHGLPDQREKLSQPLPVPGDVDWPTGEGVNLFRRFSVAYGLSSFFSKDPPIQRFPDEIDELDPKNRPRATRVEAPSKDEV